MSDLLIQWVSGLLENLPIAAGAVIAAWDLRRQLISCIEKNDAQNERWAHLATMLLDELIERHGEPETVSSEDFRESGSSSR